MKMFLNPRTMILSAMLLYVSHAAAVTFTNLYVFSPMVSRLSMVRLRKPTATG